MEKLAQAPPGPVNHSLCACGYIVWYHLAEVSSDAFPRDNSRNAGHTCILSLWNLDKI